MINAIRRKGCYSFTPLATKIKNIRSLFSNYLILNKQMNEINISLFEVDGNIRISFSCTLLLSYTLSFRPVRKYWRDTDHLFNLVRGGTKDWFSYPIEVPILLTRKQLLLGVLLTSLIQQDLYCGYTLPFAIYHYFQLFTEDCFCLHFRIVFQNLET